MKLILIFCYREVTMVKGCTLCFSNNLIKTTFYEMGSYIIHRQTGSL
jgi:hypothetical protein